MKLVVALMVAISCVVCVSPAAKADVPHVFIWTGEGKDNKWDTPQNWGTGNGKRGTGNGERETGNCVPGRLDTVRLLKDATIDLERDRMVSNILFSAKVILAGGAVHAQNTIGRGANGKLGVRAWSLLGKVKLSEGAVVAPLRGTAGYRGVLQEDAKGVTRVVLTRPSASFVWTGAAGDGRWCNEKNWTANGRPAVETPSDIDAVLFAGKLRKGSKELEVELPSGLTVVSNLVAEVPIRWKSAKSMDALGGGGANLDILDISGNGKFVVCGDARICIKGGAEKTEIVATKGTILALAAHGGRRYKSVTIEDGAELVPYDWVVEIDKLVFKGANKVRFWPPRHFNRWRPIWMIHAKRLEGKPNIFADDMSHWNGNVSKLNDGSSMLEIHFK
ncbi:MAG: hypothetical protein II840_02570 [Kiritimatiellae bacterium]|nr:hypothetical protein [Kiritimatiellia bacterium]